MSGDGRFKVEQKDTLIDQLPIPTTHTVVITDKATGDEYKGSGLTVEKAEEKAWDKVEEANKK